MSQVILRGAGDFRGPKPEILAPAGSREAFLAALAAGADAVYCGLKSYSARMAARNFTVEELAALSPLAREEGARIYLTVNTLLKPDDLLPLGRQLEQVQRYVQPHALIVQDLAVAELARQAGYTGELHLSTLANVSTAAVLKLLPKALGVRRVVLPRELDIEEVKLMAAASPPELSLEIFIHGALCYGVSGRCYWSSYLGGKSGLRGHCVQPCRRRYQQGERRQRHFACHDLSLDVLVKALAAVPRIAAWKIEGRKKGPHYVYYTTTAYRMLRDEGRDPKVKRAAVQLLEQALGRPGTHYNFLPQRPQNPIDTRNPTGSGLLAGTVHGGRQKPYVVPRLDLLPHDKLRIGYEDDAAHQTIEISRAVPKKGRYYFKLFRGRKPAKGTPVFLIDRREPFLAQRIESLNRRLAPVEKPLDTTNAFTLRLPPGSPRKPHVRYMHLLRKPGRHMRRTSMARWLEIENPLDAKAREPVHAWWWLPPTIWPAEEHLWRRHLSDLLRAGARRFVLNAPWQMALFRRPRGLNLWAGPFCNLANPLAIRAFKNLGGQGVIVSPELGKGDYEILGAKSLLPLGVVTAGFWPLCVSRVLDEELKTGKGFVSPKGETGWVRRYGRLHWVYPNWRVDLRSVQSQLVGFGYRLFVNLDEPVPGGVKIKPRPGLWNWNIGLK